MIKTIHDLQAITRSPAYQAIVLGEQEGGWQGALNSSSDTAARLHAWESLQAIAVIFETYGNAMEKVELDIEVQSEDGNLFAEASLRINGNDCMRVDDIGGFDFDFQDRLEEIDNMEALEGGVDRILSLPSQAIVRHFEVFEAATKGTFTSAEQARTKATEAAGPLSPQLTPLLTDLALSQQSQEALPSRPPTP